MTTIETFDHLVAVATSGRGAPVSGTSTLVPYDYQRRLADEGLPELLEVPTGCGKTMAVVLAWLWRRRYDPDPSVRAATPRRLVYVLPQRVLVEQVAASVREWLESLGLASEVHTAILMGGEGAQSGAWRLSPEGDAILIATQDMALSGALNRRYGTSRWSWPIDFGLLNNDCAWIFDEVQLMGPGLTTSRQLEGLRRALGTAVGCTSTWMSATVSEDAMKTVDLPQIECRLGLESGDREGHLSTRLNAARCVSRVATESKDSYVSDVSNAIAGAHQAGTRTIAVFNTVRRATEAKAELDKRARAGEVDAEIVLVHSRFRHQDRQAHLARAIADVDPAGPGVIVVTTQVLEAGVDITSDVLFTEAAPWSSVVQRAGRCNRDGTSADPLLLWAAPPSAAPYEDDEIIRSQVELKRIDGRVLTTEQMVSGGPRSKRAVYATLRRRDLLDLFDTLPDLSGADIDVSRFIRDAEDRELTVSWEDLGDEGPAPGHRLPSRLASCPVPISDAKAILGRRSWRFDHVAGAWVRCRAQDLRPGQVVIIDARDGGYDPERGWDPSSKAAVEPIGDDLVQSAGLDADNSVGADPVTFRRGRWLSLLQHLGDVESEAALLDREVAPPGLTAAQRRSVVVAGRLHDLGKAHSVFQETLAGSIGTEDEGAAASAAGPPWAKSAGSKTSRHSRRHFRHELASALALLGDGCVAIEGEDEQDLIVYLVAAHHGRIRLGFRPIPGEVLPDGDEGRVVALGVVDGDCLPPTEIPGGVLPEIEISLSSMALGSGEDGAPSWSQRMLPLRDRDDLGPFRLGYLESIVRMADWRASARADESALEVLP